MGLGTAGGLQRPDGHGFAEGAGDWRVATGRAPSTAPGTGRRVGRRKNARADMPGRAATVRALTPRSGWRGAVGRG